MSGLRIADDHGTVAYSGRYGFGVDPCGTCPDGNGRAACPWTPSQHPPQLFNTIPCHTIQYHTIPYHTVPHHTITIPHQPHPTAAYVYAAPYRSHTCPPPRAKRTNASQDIPTLVRSISDLHDLEMGGFLRVDVDVPFEDLLGGGLVHRHLRPGDIPAQ